LEIFGVESGVSYYGRCSCSLVYLAEIAHEAYGVQLAAEIGCKGEIFLVECRDFYGLSCGKVYLEQCGCVFVGL
jgi:hypothetical protein